MAHNPELYGADAMCSYYEDTWQEAAIDAIADHGFTSVLFCITEADVATDGRRLRPVIEHAQNRGLACQGDLWNFAGIFGGEAPSAFADDPRRQACLQNPAFRRLLTDGIDYAQSLGLQSLFWDEPNFSNVKNTAPCDCCTGQERELVRAVTCYAGAAALSNTLCMTTSERNFALLADCAADRSVQMVATDPYYSNFPGENDDRPSQYVGKWAARLADLSRQYPRTQTQLWVQGFHLPMPQADTTEWYAEANRRPWHEVPLRAAEAAVAAGVRNIGFWGYNACRTIPELAPPYPDRVWQTARRICDLVATGEQAAA